MTSSTRSPTTAPTAAKPGGPKRRTKIEPFNKVHGSPAASTCATDGERIVSYFGSCGLFCYDLAGKELWKHEMPTAVDARRFRHGRFAASLSMALVVLMRDVAKDPQIIALDIATGNLKWEKKRESKSSFRHADGVEYARGQVHRRARLRQDDRLQHQERRPRLVRRRDAGRCCTTPVAADGNLFFAGWSPGDPDDKDFQMPTFDAILKRTTPTRTAPSPKQKPRRRGFKDFFDNQDANKDGKITPRRMGCRLEVCREFEKQRVCTEAGRQRRRHRIAACCGSKRRACRMSRRRFSIAAST